MVRRADLISLLVIPLIFSAAEIDSTEYSKIYRLGGITVIGKRQETDSNLLLQLDPENFSFNEVSSVGEMLHYTSSVYADVGSKGGTSISIFGIEQREIAIMVDGHPIRSPYDGTVDLGQIPAEQVSSIEISVPPVSSIYGSNNLGGVVNVITKKEDRSVSMGLTQGPKIKNVINYGKKFDKLYFMVTGIYNKSDGYLLPDGTLRENSDFDKKSINAKVGMEPTPGSEIALSISAVQNKKGVPLSTERPRFRFWRFPEWKWYYGTMHGKTQLHENVKFKGNIFYDKHENTLINYTDTTYTEKRWTSVYDNHSFGEYSNIEVKLGENNTLTIGTSIKIDDVNLGDEEEIDEEHDGKTFSISLGEKVKFPGINLALNGSIGYSGFRGDNASINTPNYKLGTSYFISPEIEIFVSGGKSTRFPTLKELYGSSGNPDLEEEKSTSYQAGLNTEYVNLAVYHNNIKNLIDREDRDSPWENLEKATFTGFSINGKYNFVNLGYTYLDADDNSGNPLDRRAKHKINMGVNYKLPFGPRIKVNGTWADRRFDGADTLSSYTLLNASISQDLGEFLSLQINASNILNEWYQDEAFYPLPGRIIGGRISLKL